MAILCKLEHGQDKAFLREVKSKCLYRDVNQQQGFENEIIRQSLGIYFLLPHIGAIHFLLEGAATLKK